MRLSQKIRYYFATLVFIHFGLGESFAANSPCNLALLSFQSQNFKNEQLVQLRPFKKPLLVEGRENPEHPGYRLPLTREQIIDYARSLRFTEKLLGDRATRYKEAFIQVLESESENDVFNNQEIKNYFEKMIENRAIITDLRGRLVEEIELFVNHEFAKKYGITFIIKDRSIYAKSWSLQLRMTSKSSDIALKTFRSNNHELNELDGLVVYDRELLPPDSFLQLPAIRLLYERNNDKTHKNLDEFMREHKAEIKKFWDKEWTALENKGYTKRPIIIQYKKFKMILAYEKIISTSDQKEIWSTRWIPLEAMSQFPEIEGKFIYPKILKRLFPSAHPLKELTVVADTDVVMALANKNTPLEMQDFNQPIGEAWSPGFWVINQKMNKIYWDIRQAVLPEIFRLHSEYISEDINLSVHFDECLAHSGDFTLGDMRTIHERFPNFASPFPSSNYLITIHPEKGMGSIVRGNHPIYGNNDFWRYIVENSSPDTDLQIRFPWTGPNPEDKALTDAVNARMAIGSQTNN